MTDNIFKCLYMNENVSIFIEISPTFIHQGPINNNCRAGDKPLSEPMTAWDLTYDLSKF